MKQIRFMIEVTLPDDESKATVRIGCDCMASLAAQMIATEHMMTMFAAGSDAGFEKALELLCEGARKNRVEVLSGIPRQ
jgi:hypothetical protein